MTPCEQCHSSPATVHITRISNDSATVSHLCEACAREKGIMVEVPPDGQVQEIDLSATRADVSSSPAAETPLDTRECGHCHFKFTEFAASGRLGCPRCYEEFEKDVSAMLSQVHGATKHKGKQYSRREAALMAGEDVEKLRTELSDAIVREEFELAALLRDRLRGLDHHRDAESTEKTKN